VIKTVILSSRAEKSLDKCPEFIGDKLEQWRLYVVKHGLHLAQRIPSYHDEPLKGALSGLRSIRLTLKYRAYYRIVKEQIEFVLIEEVNLHDYKKIARR